MRIFISYRRRDTLPIVGRIYDHLINKFGESNVFMDFDSIKAGTDFRVVLSEKIEDADIMLAIIGGNWLQQSTPANKDNEGMNDYVRIELETAINKDIKIIPVLVDGASMPTPDQMGTTLEKISYLHATNLNSGRDFKNHISRLINEIENLSEIGTQKLDATNLKQILTKNTINKIATGLLLGLISSLAHIKIVPFINADFSVLAAIPFGIAIFATGELFLSKKILRGHSVSRLLFFSAASPLGLFAATKYGLNFTNTGSISLFIAGITGVTPLLTMSSIFWKKSAENISGILCILITSGSMGAFFSIISSENQNIGISLWQSTVVASFSYLTLKCNNKNSQ